MTKIEKVFAFAFVITLAMFVATLLHGQVGYTNIALGETAPTPCQSGTIFVKQSTLMMYMCQADGSTWGFYKMPITVQAATHAFVTGTGATGFQISTTQDANVVYNVTTAVTATIGGASSGTIVLEVAPTNSATAGDWVEAARFTNGQTITLAVALQSVQTLASALPGFVPAGYFAKLRSITAGGSPVYTYNSGREALQ